MPKDELKERRRFVPGDSSLVTPSTKASDPGPSSQKSDGDRSHKVKASSSPNEDTAAIDGVSNT